MTARRVFFYVQHLLGIGHLARASRIAQALMAHGFTVTLAAGGMPAAGFPGPRIETVALPAVKAAAGFSGLEDAEGRPVGEDFKAHRRALLLAALANCRPDIVIVEAFPFGRRQMRFELLPLLEAAAAMTPKPIIACSVRDILQQSAKPGRSEETVALVARYFDLVLVHGDPRFCRLEETFPLAGAFADKVRYSGLVAGPLPQAAADRFDTVVSAGGGAAGQRLLEAAMAAARHAAGRWCLLAGPHLPSQVFDQLQSIAPLNVGLFAFRADFPGLLVAAQVSVSQAGYNTVCDILRARCRAVLVPYSAAGETEQTTRAARLAARGLAIVLAESDLTPARLGQAIAQALAAAPAHATLDLEGAPQTARLLAALSPGTRN